MNRFNQNIMTNAPTDQLSRWFTDSDAPSQYIMLKLHSPAIVETITFGKYIKAHVSDLKKFQILGGTEDKNLSIILTGGLKNDNSSETFHLRHRTAEGLYLPITYLKIIPLQSWGPAYNYTIWYVELHGKNNEELMQTTLETISLRKEEEAVRILLKHLRRRRYKDAFEALSRESGVRLEGQIQARLWNTLVENADYDSAERIMDEAVGGKNKLVNLSNGISDGELEWYMSWQPYTPRWRQISTCSAHVEERLCRLHADLTPPPPPAPITLPPANTADVTCADRDWIDTGTINGSESCEGCETLACDQGACACKPGPRGGHQLVVDSTTGTLYLFGGWNGTEDLDDLWSFNISIARWTLLCRHSVTAGGPSPRSCHKMVYDPTDRKLYTLGRYLDHTQRTPENMKSDLYAWDVTAGEWQLVCADTAAAGGPRLVFDHQMCIDPDTHTIYVFGGRVLPTNNDEVICPQYSGLYAYYARTDTWQLLLPDQHQQNAPQPRVGHSMLFHPVQRRLYIFAGQRNKEHLLDLWWWDVDAGVCGALAAAPATPCPPPPPAAGFTQRATLDPDTDEMFVLSGMSKEKDKRVYNALWVFSLRRRTWSCVYRSERAAVGEPRPRFAHQLVYDPVTKVHYLFGGNPGSQSSPRLRLDDLWALVLARPALATIAGRARAALREAHYRELAAMAARDPSLAPQALHYLRHRVHEVLDHSDPKQVERFQKLATVLFAGGEDIDTGVGAREPAARALSPTAARRLARRRARAASTGPQAELSRSLAAVLGADDIVPELLQPFEETTEPELEPAAWDRDPPRDHEVPDRAHERDYEWEMRATRLRLYDQLCQYFRPSTVPPRADVSQLVTL
ncbi:Muskelin [Eumeta japonica]|uniref:Muskelin n=1 Tax=Eumeta variegata TaxID=151549 RepID=A0A4C1WX08_EUMVA|nr:Muskelin [Eumeta japonica]